MDSSPVKHSSKEVYSRVLVWDILFLAYLRGSFLTIYACLNDKVTAFLLNYVAAVTKKIATLVLESKKDSWHRKRELLEWLHRWSLDIHRLLTNSIEMLWALWFCLQPPYSYVWRAGTVWFYPRKFCTRLWRTLVWSIVFLTLPVLPNSFTLGKQNFQLQCSWGNWIRDTCVASSKFAFQCKVSEGSVFIVKMQCGTQHTPPPRLWIYIDSSCSTREVKVWELHLSHHTKQEYPLHSLTLT